MWRRDELKPIPDSMSQFTDFETLFCREALHCGLVKRQSHRHWVHIVGTEYDLVEWDEPAPLDQGVGAPKIVTAPESPVVLAKRQEVALQLTAALGVDLDTCMAALKTCNDDAAAAAQKLQAAQDQNGDDDDEGGQGMPQILRNLGLNLRGRNPPQRDSRPKPPEIVDSIEFAGILYNRHFDPYSQLPHFGLQYSSEYWVADLLGPLLNAVYPEEPEEKKMKYKLLLSALPLAENSTVARLLGFVDPRKLDATWKEVLVYRNRRIVQVFNLVSHGRRLYRTLIYSSDNRFALHCLPPNTNDRSSSLPACVVAEAGDFKRKILNEPSLVITRANNLLAGHETYIPARLLQGVVPSALLEAFR
jgi:hypothetical protein